jgi:hypothetical protein
MPRRIKPRTGWRFPHFRPGVPDDDVRARYPDALFDRIARDFKLADQDLANLKSCALHAGAIYKQFATLRDDRPQRAEVVASLVDLRGLIERVHREAESPDDVTWSALWRAEEELQEECVWGESPAMREVGAMWDSGDGEVTFYTRDDLLPVMRYMSLLLDRAIEKAPRSKRGQKRQEPVRQWAKPILDFWERDAGKKVTYEHFGGNAITETHRFLEALLQPLDASATRYLGTVLEEERTARKRR